MAFLNLKAGRFCLLLLPLGPALRKGVWRLLISAERPRTRETSMSIDRAAPHVHRRLAAVSNAATRARRPTRTLSKSRLVGLLLLVSLALWVPESARASSSEPALDAQRCTSDTQGALSEIGCELRRALALGSKSSLVVAARVEGAPNETSASQLALQLANVVASAIGEHTKAASRTADQERAIGLAGSAGLLIHLKPKLRGGDFEVVADAFAVSKSFWDRAREQTPVPVAHAFAVRGLDPELRSYLPPVPILARDVHRAKLGIDSPVALACGDLTGDRNSELLVVGRHELAVGRVRSGAFTPELTAPWRDLSEVAPAPARQPMASAYLTHAHAWIGLSDRRHGVLLDSSLRRAAQLGRVLPWAPEGCARVDSMRIQALPIPCEGEAADSPNAPVLPAANAIAGAKLEGHDGSPRIIRALVSAAQNRLIVTDSLEHRLTLENVGAQVAVGDLDGDGMAELVTTRATLKAEQDAVDVRTWTATGSVIQRYALPVPEGVTALAVCPPENLGLAPLAIATATEIWIVQ